MMTGQTYRLKDICRIKSGKRIPLGMDFTTNITNYPYLRARDIKGGKIQTDDLIYIDEAVFNKIKKYIIKSGDIAITIVGASVGDVAYAQKEVDGFNLTENAVRLTEFNSIVNGKYLFYVLNQEQYHEYMQTVAGGAAQPKLGIYKVERIKVVLPPLKIQKKIASILSAYDNLIENNNKRIRLLEQMAENLYKEWFVRFRFPGHEKVEMENGLPKGWNRSPLKTICEFSRGKNITSIEMESGDVPVISAGISPSGFHNKSNVKGTSVTVSSSGANAGFISVHYEDIWAADCSYVSEDGTNNIYFVYETLNNIRTVVDNLQRGAAQPHVYPKDLNRIVVVIPSEKLQVLANERFKQIHLLISKLQQQNERLSRQRDLLLPRLMSGKLEVKLGKVKL